MSFIFLKECPGKLAVLEKQRSDIFQKEQAHVEVINSDDDQQTKADLRYSFPLFKSEVQEMYNLKMWNFYFVERNTER